MSNSRCYLDFLPLAVVTFALVFGLATDFILTLDVTLEAVEVGLTAFVALGAAFVGAVVVAGAVFLETGVVAFLLVEAVRFMRAGAFVSFLVLAISLSIWFRSKCSASIQNSSSLP